MYKRMLSAYSHKWLAVLLAVFCHAQALAPSHHNNRLANRGFDNETRCSWDCTVTDSDLTEEMNTAIAKGSLINLVVEYKNKVDDKCVNQTARNSSGNVTEHFQIWLANNKLSTFATVMESLKNLMFDTDVNEESEKIIAVCSLKPLGTIATAREYSSENYFPMSSQGHLAALGVNLNTIECSTAETENLQPCVNVTKSTDNYSSSDSKNPFERSGWPVAVLYCFSSVFSAVFIYYSPAFLCFLSATEVTEFEDGGCQILLDGASPVSFRSLIGNYFFLVGDVTIWHRARSFILRVVIIPLPFVAPAIFASISFFRSSTYQQFLLVCCGFYFIQAFYISFFTTKLFQAKPCFVCRIVEPKTNFSCQDDLPRLIIGHLRLQPLILVKSWRLFIRCLVSYFKITLIELPWCHVSIVYLLRFIVFIFFLSTVPAVAVILFMGILLAAFFGIILSSPMVMLCQARTAAINVPFFVVSFMRCCFTIPSIFGGFCVLLTAGFGILLVLLLVFRLLFSEESLPYVACAVLVLYYVWSSYSTFTNNYQDLALALYKQPDKFLVIDRANTDQIQENIAVYFEDEIKIPKRLFHTACEELMPIREGFCIMILKITIIASFVFLVFSTAMLRTGGATPVMKALLTFLTGLFPKILAIYIDGGRQKKIKAMVANEKIPKIVQEYIKQTKRTTGTSSCNQAQENFGTDADEVVLLNEDEENITLVNV